MNNSIQEISNILMGGVQDAAHVSPGAILFILASYTVAGLLVWALISILIHIARLRAKAPDGVTVWALESWDNYIMIHEANWDDPDRRKWLTPNNEEIEHKKTGVLLTTADDGPKRKSDGTIRRTSSKDFAPRGEGKGTPVIGLPKSMIDDLDLDIGKEGAQIRLSIKPYAPGWWERLWYNPDDALKISFRTTVYVTIISTVLGAINSAIFQYLL